MRTVACLAFAAVVSTAAVGWAAAGGFTFATPPGWVNVSKDAPAAEREKVAPEMLARVDSSGFAFVALDLEHADDGFVENVNAVVRTGGHPPLITAPFLDELEKGIVAEGARQGMSYRTLKKEVVKVAGVTAGRIAGELQTPTVVTRMVQYAIPGDEALATLTFSATPETFARYEPIFEAAAQATRGAVEPRSRWASIGRSAAQKAAIGAVVGGLVAAVGALIRKKKKKAA